ncbi:MAG: bifunctional (p)ppGpp synthetase/guanosine-3',5'-bis(diphosphate) 3'-pyrophosphohydrolase [Nitrospinae bacterium]|nr:bifunctional (p)ppGpp synthetase/guanosine-3',5'-bis(diphosphate) 3'-pyrophosphohydrolase [Nitrospinota bacterium]
MHEGDKIIDLAYEVNPEMGENCTGGINENKKLSVYKNIRDGQQYSLKFDPSKISLKNDWLLHAKSAKARPLIQKWLSTRRKSKGVIVGEGIIQHYLKLLQIDQEKFKNSETLTSYFDLNNIDMSELYYRIATGSTKVQELFYYFDDPETYKSISRSRFSKKLLKSINKYKKFEYIVNDVEDYFIKFSGCCIALPEARNSKGLLTPRGIAIHTAECKNYQSNYEKYSNNIDIKWNLKKNEYETAIHLILEDKIGALNLLFSKATKYKLSVDTIVTRKTASEMNVAISFKTDGFKRLINFVDDLIRYPEYLQLTGRTIKVL